MEAPTAIEAPTATTVLGLSRRRQAQADYRGCRA
jgi:hypothetical protein